MRKLRSPAAGRTAGQIATIAFALAILGQILLITGVLPIAWAWGCRQTELTPALQLGGLAAVIILALSAYVIRRRAGLVGGSSPGRLVIVLAWVITAFLFLNTLANFASPSLGEKLIFGPLALIAALACLVAAWSRLTD